MSSPAPHTATASTGASSNSWRSRSILWIAVAAVLGFAAGFLVQSSRLNGAQHELEWTARAMHAARSEAALGAAVIEAQSGRYEAARQRTSDFYAGLQRQVLPRLATEHQAAARSLLSERDSIITTLARSDPASVGVLVSVLERLRETLQRAAPDSSAVADGPRQ